MRILVIEDEQRIADSIKKGLELEQYVVDVSYDGEEGLDYALSEEYDVILLDMMLPTMSGLDVCKDIRKNGITTPILILTAKGQPADKIEGLDTGADDYVTKPFNFDELVARIRALTRRPRKLHDTKLIYDDLVVNTQTFEVSRNGVRITLSKKEFQLLEYLIRHKGQTKTKEQIMHHVWSFDSEILPNTVEVTIRNLRNKIESPFPKKHPLIHTRRGFGYSLVV